MIYRLWYATHNMSIVEPHVMDYIDFSAPWFMHRFLLWHYKDMNRFRLERINNEI